MSVLPILALSVLPAAFPRVAAAAQEVEVGTLVGQVYPDLELPTIDGDRTIRLSELRGKRVLLVEFASW